LAAGATGSVNITLTIVDPLPFGLKEVINRVGIASGSCGSDADLTNNNDTEPTPVVGNPDLTITKSDNGASMSADANGAVVYQLTYSNIGDVDATAVVITEKVPVYTKFVAASSTTGWSCADNSPANTICTFTVGRVAAGATGSVNFAVIPYSYVSGRAFAMRCPENNTVNTVSISADSALVEKDYNNNNATDSTPINALPNLAVTKSDGIDNNDRRQYKRAGDNIDYTITWVNNGNREASNAVLSDTVPAYTTFNARESSSGWNCENGGVEGSKCTVNLGSIAPGQSGSIHFVVVLGAFPADVNTTRNTAIITSDCGEADPSDNIAVDDTPLIGFYDLIVQVHGYCNMIVWTLSYQNKGNLTSRMAFIKAHVPHDTMFNAAESDAAWVCDNITSGSECLLFLGALECNAAGSVLFAVDTIHTSMDTDFTLFASIDDDWRGEDLDPTPEDNRAQATIGLDGCDTCDSCCPPVDTCCPDQTDVAFNFGGVLDGLKQCS